MPEYQKSAGENATPRWSQRFRVFLEKELADFVSFAEMGRIFGCGNRGNAWQGAAGLVRRMGIAVRGDGDNEVSLMLPNESRIVGLPGVADTTRGFSAVSMLVIDEAARRSALRGGL